jgi:hypothetical protein
MYALITHSHTHMRQFLKDDQGVVYLHPSHSTDGGGNASPNTARL